ncbi:MAG: Mrp/NBP35 family ATP-binding protein [Rhodospirillales bacterium]|nr:Mrp/NBP35 family ATP-binding protein [Rhodospirillales bacterium]
MARVSEAQILEALAAIRVPGAGKDIAVADSIEGLAIREGNVSFAITIDPSQAKAMESLRKQAEDIVFALPGVSSASVALTAHRDEPPPKAPAPAKASLPNLGAIVAVASGKGGVGKSTTATNLALALAARRLSVGLMDADIYGPSQPRMMGLSGRPSSPDGKTIVPHERYGVRCMSIGFLVGEDTPMIWRGPMVQSALMQMMRDVAWGPLDVLVVDMPPGTGDAQLTMAQQVALTGAVIVSTPQSVALADVKKAVNMFRKVDVPILGVVENMSLYICPRCGHEDHIFAHGGARKEAEARGLPFLGEIPCDPAIREASDEGQPIVVSAPEGRHAETYRAIAEAVWNEVEARQGSRQRPSIVME